jgi:hypothetical protein
LIKILCVGQNVFAFYFQRLSKVLAFINTGINPGRDLLFVEHSEEGAKRMYVLSPGSRFLGCITQMQPQKNARSLVRKAACKISLFFTGAKSF